MNKQRIILALLATCVSAQAINYNRQWWGDFFAYLPMSNAAENAAAQPKIINLLKENTSIQNGKIVDQKKVEYLFQFALDSAVGVPSPLPSPNKMVYQLARNEWDANIERNIAIAKAVITFVKTTPDTNLANRLEQQLANTERTIQDRRKALK